MRIFPGIILWLRMPALIGLICLAIGIVAGYVLSSPPSQALIVYPPFLPYAITFSAGALFFFPSRLVLCPAFFATGFLLAQHQYVSQEYEYTAWRAAYVDTRYSTLSGCIAGAVYPNKAGYSFVVKADSLCSWPGPGLFKHKNIICYSPLQPPDNGRVTLTGIFKPALPKQNPADFNGYLYSLSNGIWGTLYVKSVDSSMSSHSFFATLAKAVRKQTTRALALVSNEDYRGILLAAFLNDQSDLSINMKTLFFQAGIYHLIALSGFNIALLAAALFVLLMPLPLPREWKIILMVMLVWLYLFFVGVIPSLFRAVIMTTIVGASFLLQRKTYGLNSLAVAGVVWLVMSPLSLFTPSFQLSFAATFGLIALSPIISEVLPTFGQGLLRKGILWINTAAAVSLSCFIVTLPILVYHFKQLYLFGLIANLFSVALMAAAMWFGMAAFLAQLIFPPIVGICMQAAQLCLHLMIQTVSLVRFVPWTAITCSIPYAEFYVVFTLVLIAVIVVEKKIRLKLTVILIPAGIVICLISLLFHKQEPRVQTIFFQTRGAGLAAIQWPDNKAWILGIGDENHLQSTAQRVVLAWANASGSVITKIFLPHFQGNVVHFLSPLTTSARSIEVVYADTLYDHDENFIAFANHSGWKRTKVRFDTLVVAAPQCSCKILSGKNDHAGMDMSFVVRAFNKIIYIPDPGRFSSLFPTKAARIITVRKSKPIQIEYSNSSFYTPVF